MKRKGRGPLLAGLFSITGALLLVLVIFTIGKERHIFGERMYLRAYFLDVAGLSVGAPVHLAGMEVGRVESIKINEDLKDKRIEVTISIEEGFRERLRSDSEASIASKGLLGDKIISITIGSMSKPKLLDGDEIRSVEPPDYFAFLEKGQLILDRGAVVAGEMVRVLQNIGSDQNIKNVSDTLASVRNITRQVETGPGIAHMLLYDKRQPQYLDQTLANAARISSQVSAAIAKVDKLITDVEQGGGVLHTLIYDERGNELVVILEEALSTVRDLITHVQDKDGILHTLIYESPDLNFLKELNQAAKDLKEIIAFIKSGQGSLGGIITDPTLYEDLKLLVSDLKRNKVLKSIIRYSISNRPPQAAPRDEQVSRPPAETAPDAATPDSPSSPTPPVTP